MNPPFDESGSGEEDKVREKESELAEEQSAEPAAGTESGGSPPQVTSSSGIEEGGPPDSEGEGFDGRMTFLEHLDELRKRIIYSVIPVVVAAVGSWVLREEIFEFLAVPIRQVLGGDDLVFTKVTDPFTIYLKVSFVTGIFLAVPFVLIQVWLFIAPGLYRKEKGYAIPFLLSSTVLFLLGGIFAYYIILPTALEFLIKGLGSKFQPMLTAIDYFGFEVIILVGMGVVFQLPVLVAFLSLFGMVTPRFLWKNFRYAFLLIVIAAAVVSPTPDALNLAFWVGPMVVLYLVSICVSWVFSRRRDAGQR